MVKTVLLNCEDRVFNPPEPSCVICLPGLPGGGSKVYDRSAYGNHGTVTGATWVKLPSGLWCLSFDGVDDYVNVDDGTELKPASLITLKTWLYKTGDGTGNEQGLISKRNIANNNGYWLLHYEPSDRLYFGLKTADSLKSCYSNVGIANGTWYHFVGTFDGTTLRQYVNTVLQGNTNTGNAPISHDTTPLYLGRQGSAYFKGYIAIPEIHSGVVWTALDAQNSFNREKRLFGVW